MEFTASFGDEQKTVRISHVNTGSGGYAVLIDNYYYGDLIKRNGEWILMSNTNKLTIDDIQILGELVEKNYK
ncbi:hypothetical protein [Mucilaginibacter sp.]|uniref:hypothetical protein n=1 Tax=Mucilaginibacter sp. TaxID=1882438 RepID=UPI0026043D8E|nr:hypothetical protein [Mucilaginibacter sp.]MDB4919862.1 hypothetical protein [Mucilaginibacter sp.]